MLSGGQPRSTKRRRSGEVEETEDDGMQSIEAIPATPETQGWGDTQKNSGLFTPSFIMSPMQSFRHEESLIIANNAKERYRRSLEAEMERNRELAAKLAESEERAKHEAIQLKEESKRRDESLVKQLAEAQAAVVIPSEGLFVTDKEHLAVKSELENCKENMQLLKQELEAALKEVEHYKQSAENSFRELSEKISTLLPAIGQEPQGQQEQKLRDLQILNKHLSSSLEQAKQDIAQNVTLRKEVEGLRKEQREYIGLEEKSAKLKELLDKSTEEEAKLRAERDDLGYWKVSLAIGFSEHSSPAEVIASYKQLQHENLELVRKCSAVEQRERDATAQYAALEQRFAAAEKQTRELQALVTQREGDLILERSAVERLKQELRGCQLMISSFKAEEVFVRDEEVVSLRKQLEAQTQASKNESKAAAAELAKAKEEISRIREEARKDRDMMLATQSTLNKTKSELSALKTTLEDEKSNAAAARNKAFENDKALRGKLVEAERAFKLKVSEMEKNIQQHSTELAQAKQEAAEAVAKAAADVKAANAHLRASVVTCRKKEDDRKKVEEQLKRIEEQRKKADDMDRIMPALLGINFGGTYKKAQDDQVERELLITAKSRLTDRPDVLLIKALVPVQDPSALPKLSLQDRPKNDALGQLVDKHLTATAGTAAEHAGLPGLISAIVSSDFERLVSNAAAAAAAAAAAGAAGAAARGASPVRTASPAIVDETATVPGSS